MSGKRSFVRFWMGIAPAFLTVTLALPLVRMGLISWLFPALLLVSLAFIWVLKGVGGLIAAVGMTLYLSLSNHQIGQGHLTWQIAFITAVALSLLIFGYALLEGESEIEVANAELAESLSQLEKEQSEQQELWNQERDEKESKYEALNEEMRAAYDEVESYKRLVVASQEEAEKYYKLYNASMKSDRSKSHTHLV